MIMGSGMCAKGDLNRKCKRPSRPMPSPGAPMVPFILRMTDLHVPVDPESVRFSIDPQTTMGKWYHPSQRSTLIVGRGRGQSSSSERK
jgi:quercetin dioxygenase-like cupin family protein